MNNPRFWRQLRLLALLRGLYVALAGLSLGGLVAVVINIFTRKSP